MLEKITKTSENEKLEERIMQELEERAEFDCWANHCSQSYTF